MKNLKLLSLFAIATFSLVKQASAQDGTTDNHNINITIPEVAILDIEPAGSKNITMSFTSPGEAGLPLIAPASNSTLWLNYSSIIAAVADVRTVSVSLDALVPGVDINLTAAAATGTGAGELGAPVGTPITLTTTDQTIITGIGSAYTGDGSGNGHNLTYTLGVGTTGGAAYADLVASSTIATVTYTISDN